MQFPLNPPSEEILNGKLGNFSKNNNATVVHYNVNTYILIIVCNVLMLNLSTLSSVLIAKEETCRNSIMNLVNVSKVLKSL